MILKKFTLIVTCWIFLFQNLSAQTGRKLDEISISINDLNLNRKELPFDVPFYIEVTDLENVSTISFSYQIKDILLRKKSWITFPLVESDENKTYVSPTVNVKNNKATLYCPGLHPNVAYDFTFEFLKTLPKEDLYREQLRNKIGNSISRFTKKYAAKKIIPEDREELYKEIDAVIKEHVATQPGEKIVRKDDPNTEYKTRNKDYQAAYSLLRDAHNKRISALTNINGPAGAELLLTKFGLVAKVIIDSLPQLQAKETIWSSELKKAMVLPVDVKLNQFKDYTLNDGLEILKLLANKPYTLNEILVGNKKIEDKEIVKTEAIDMQSVKFIFSLLKILNEGIVEYTIDSNLNVLFTDEQFSSSFRVFKSMMNDYNDIAAADLDIAEAVASTKDITIEILVAQSITQDVITIPEVETAQSPYISIETGIGMATGYSSAFGYYVANFYFVPINKNAPLNSFKGWNKFFKMFSVQAGIANFLGKRPEYSHSIFGDNSSRDLMLGVGMRFTKLLRINAGTILYKTNKDNPLLDKYHVKPSVYVSAGIDINFLKAIGTVADLFKL
ncbi:hypothetical protein [Sphingobacterium sp. MYb388]|uniref:hypothetical protein n=1 Tax=Sphingobacterium sp. MYb388 TaxID=2745437 RepID=UPI0030972FD8